MLDSTIQTDVIIVGAVPMGLSLAIQLMRYNINFVVFDAKNGVTERSKALVIHARALELDDQVSLAKPAIAAGEPVRGGALLHDGKTNARMDFSDFVCPQYAAAFDLATESGFPTKDAETFKVKVENGSVFVEI